MEIQCQTSEFFAADGLRLFRRTWIPKAAPRAVFVLVHGIGEHGGRYGHVGNFFAQHGFCVTAADLRGHGRSEGIRGHIETWADFRGDLDRLVFESRSECPSLPLFILGHSLGGLIGLDYCLAADRPASGLICSSPAIGDLGIPKILLLLSEVLSRFAPKFRTDTRLDVHGLSRDPAIAEALMHDSLSHRYGSVRLSTEVGRIQRAVFSRAGDLTIPFLLLLGTADRIVYPAKSRAFFHRVPCGRKQLLEYEGAYHELHNDIVRDRVFHDMLGWLESGLPRAGEAL